MADFGETLRQARAHKNVTLREVEADTRINRHHLAALENEDFGALPAPIYTRGIVRKYADYLGLDAGKMLDMHREATGGSQAHEPVQVVPAEMQRMWTPNFAIMAFGVVLSAILLAWGYSIWNSPGDVSLTPSPAVTSVSTATTRPADSPRPTPPAAPTAVATDVPKIVSGGDNQTTGNATIYRTGVGVTVTADTHVSMAVDGTVVYDDLLGAGMSTDMFVGSDFTVTTSDGSASYFFNSCGTTSADPMSANPGDYTVSFSAHSRSCAPPDGN